MPRHTEHYYEALHAATLATPALRAVMLFTIRAVMICHGAMRHDATQERYYAASAMLRVMPWLARHARLRGAMLMLARRCCHAVKRHAAVFLLMLLSFAAAMLIFITLISTCCRRSRYFR